MSWEDELEDAFGDSWEWVVDQIVVKEGHYDEYLGTCPNLPGFVPHDYEGHSVHLTNNARVFTIGGVTAVIGYLAGLSGGAAVFAAGGVSELIKENQDAKRFTFGGYDKEADDGSAAFQWVGEAGRWQPHPYTMQPIIAEPGHPGYTDELAGDFTTGTNQSYK